MSAMTLTDKEHVQFFRNGRVNSMNLVGRIGACPGFFGGERGFES